jgi:hypothetical protein
VSICFALSRSYYLGAIDAKAGLGVVGPIVDSSMESTYVVERACYEVVIRILRLGSPVWKQVAA